MTNREWYIDKITTMSDEELAHFIEVEDNLWCGDNCESYNCNCEKCMIDWLKEKHVEPMPELRVGMFVKVRHNHSTEDYIGVITLDENDNKVIVYKETTWDFVARVKDNIIAIYKTNCFIDCDDEHCIWRA